jgi:RNA polymerase sigma-70 factor (ECF subfamily)
LLAISGHTRSEIGWLLRVSDMAVRQYVSEIRRRWQRSGERQRGDILHLAGSLAFGRIRHGLRNHVMASPDVVLASHDPDGYGFSIKLTSQKQP